MKKLILITYVLLTLAVTMNAQQKDFPKLTGPYLGQTPPGTTPEIFAPGIVSLPEFVEYSGTFSPDGMEYYFYRFSSTAQATIYCSKVVAEQWTNPEPVGFSAGYAAYEPHVTFDNRSLYFAWNRGAGLYGIWVTKRDSQGWSAPKYAGQGMFVTSDALGNLYTTDMSAANTTGKTYLAKVTVTNDLFSKYDRLTISAHYGTQAHPGIAPDGSYILFDVQSGNYMYVSFKRQDGTWGEAIDLTKHGFDPMAGGANISPDGKYIFFCWNKDIWWVSTKIIDDLRPAHGVLAYAITPPDGNAEIFMMNADGTGKTQLTNQPGRPYGPAFSPDNTKIAFYNHLSDQTWSLYLMNADGTNVQRLTNASNTLDWSPDWSSDGSQIVFARSYSSPTWRSEIWIMNADGSNLHRLGNVEGQGPDWSPDGSKISYFNYVENGGDIWIMNADGTNPTKLTDNQSEDWWPKFSPDGSKIAFQSKRDGNHEIYVMNSDGSNPVRLTNNSADDEDPNWSPDGTKIAFISMRDGHYEIYTMNADGSNQTRITSTNGNAIDPDWKPLVSDLSHDPLIAFNSDRSGNTEIFTVNISGNNLKQVTNNTFIDYWPSWSSDGSRIAYSSVVNGNCDIYVVNQDGTSIQRLTQNSAIDREPAWSLDDTRIAFESNRDGNPEIYSMNANGTNTVRLTNNSAIDIYAHWSPDCQKITFCSNRDGNFEIYSMDADGSNPMRLTNNASNDWTPKWSPDGKKITFVSERDGNREIYVMNPDGSNQKRITNHPGIDIEPDWSHDGLKMVFVSDRNGNQDIYMAELSDEYDIIRCIQVTNDPSSDRHPVWQPRKNPTSVKESGQSFNALPNNFQLFQNYPNPFNSTTTIRYHLPHSGKMSLQIFDIMGRLVHTIIDDQQPAGDYQISWDGADNNGLRVSTGVYLCQLTVDRYRLTNKLALIK